MISSDHELVPYGAERRPYYENIAIWGCSVDPTCFRPALSKGVGKYIGKIHSKYVYNLTSSGARMMLQAMVLGRLGGLFTAIQERVLYPSHRSGGGGNIR